MAKNKSSDSKLLDKFNAYIDLLRVNGYSLSDIATTLSIYKTNKKTKTEELDLAAFNHIRSGERKIFKENTLGNLIDVLEADSKFKKVLLPKSIDGENFAHTFLWYYWSHYKTVGVAFIGINKAVEEGNNLQQGTLHYLMKDTYGNYTINKSRVVQSFYHIANRSLEFVISKHQNSPRSYIIADLGGEPLDDVTISYCSFSGSASAVQGVYAGIGMIEHIQPRMLEQRLKEIAIKIPAPILNALYYRRVVKGESEPGSHSSIAELRQEQINFISNIKGYWQGLYIRKHIHEDRLDGGLAKVLMHVDESGYIQVFVKSEYKGNVIVPYYTGMIYFPDNEKENFIVGKLVPTKVGIHRIRFHLNLHNDSLGGIMSGWRKDDNIYFTRVILLEQISTSSPFFNLEKMSELIGEYQPKHYGRKKLGRFKRELEKIQELELEFIHSFNNCLGRDGGVQLDLLS